MKVMKKITWLVWCMGSILMIFAIFFIIHITASIPQSSVTLSPEPRERHILDNKENLQKYINQANQGDLYSIEKVAAWYHLKGDAKEAAFWDQRSNEIRIKLGLPTRDEIIRMGLPRNSGNNYKADPFRSP